MNELEWFRSIDEIPGVTWSPPDSVELDRRWPDATPRQSGQWVEWVDAEGHEIGEPDDHGDIPPPRGSPATLLAPDEPAKQPLGEVVASTCSALGAPGLRSDYLEVLDFVGRNLSYRKSQDADALEWADRLDRLAVDLLVAGVRRAASPLADANPDVMSRHLELARAVFDRLARRYMPEGFLLEAAEVLDRLADLGEIPPRDYPEPFDPRRALASLEELSN